MKVLRFIIGLGVVGAVLVGSLVAFLAARPYWSPELPEPDLVESGWKIHDHESLGFSIEVPAAYEPQFDADGMRLRFDGATLVLVTWQDERIAESRGLWARHDAVGEVELGGRPADKYEYNHFDAIVGVHTLSWVVPYRGKFLALEIRTRRASILEDLGIELGANQSPNEVVQRIVASFRFH